jgi:hypothetical protein
LSSSDVAAVAVPVPGRALGEVVRLGESLIRIAGHLELITVPGGLRPLRLPKRSWDRFPPASAILANVVSQASGVRLVLHTAATRVSLKVRCTQLRIEGNPGPVNRFVATVDGHLVAAARAEVDAFETMPMDGSQSSLTQIADGSRVELTSLPPGVKTVTIWLPQALIVDLLGIEADAPITPGRSELPRWVHYGSSISHCADPDDPTAAWPVVAAQAAGLEVTNLGFAGQCMLDPFVAEAIAATPAEVISLKVGINVIGSRSMDQRTFTPAVHGFLDRIRESQPDTPIVVCSSILWPGNEDIPGPADAEVFDDGSIRCYAYGDRDDIAKGALTLATSRTHLGDLVRGRAAAGEPIFYLDGLELYGEMDAASAPLPDGLHPSASVYQEMGRRFAALVFGREGLVPSVSLTEGRTQQQA